MTNLFQETKILVAGSINPKISKEYSEAAKVIGEYIYEKNYALVFDGCFGLPGEVAKRMVEMGKEKYKQWDEWMALPTELKEKRIYPIHTDQKPLFHMMIFILECLNGSM